MKNPWGNFIHPDTWTHDTHTNAIKLFYLSDTSWILHKYRYWVTAITRSPVTIETALARPLRSLSDHTQITLWSFSMFFDVGIVEIFSCYSPYVENIFILYIGSSLSGRNSQVTNIPPCLVGENKSIEVGGGGGEVLLL